MDSSANSCSITSVENNAKNLVECSTTVLKDCTNSHVSLMSDNVDDHEPLAKRHPSALLHGHCLRDAVSV